MHEPSHLEVLHVLLLTYYNAAGGDVHERGLGEEPNDVLPETTPLLQHRDSLPPCDTPRSTVPEHSSE